MTEKKGPVLKKKRIGDIQQIKDSANDTEKPDIDFRPNEGNFQMLISTGSTLLDLAISGSRVKGGGVPGGVLVEIFGPSQSGKTALLAEMCGSAQLRGGEVRFADPEARLDQAYVQYYGVNVLEDFFDYHRPDTVDGLFSLLHTWQTKRTDVVNLFAGDSAAALSTEEEMESEDKMGMKRAKDFSTGLRKTCRLIANNNWIVAFTNQIRQGTAGKVTPGGLAVPFYASIRIKIEPTFQKSKILSKIKLSSGVELEKVIGINSVCTVIKSVDAPYREAPIRILFNHGVDDIGANLQYIKDMTKATKYDAITKECASLYDASRHIETEGLEKELRQKTIDLWEEIQSFFDQKTERKRKERF